MAARRGKNQAKRNSGKPVPGWVWLLAGLGLGVALFLFLPGLMKQDGDGFMRFGPKPNPDAQPAPVAGADVEAVVPETPQPAEDAPRETRFDFYTLLPGQEVEVTDAELAASAREEANRAARERDAEAARARAALMGQDVAPRPNTQPTPISEAPATAATPATQPSATATEPAAAATVASAASGSRYILQAGAFGAASDAETAKAKVAMLGLNARVETAEINGRTVYRVRMGPYGTAGELAEAKQKLANGGLDAMAIRAQ